jgi:hypothetical protein
MSGIWWVHPLLHWGCNKNVLPHLLMAAELANTHPTFFHFTLHLSRIRIDLIPCRW